MGNRKSRPVEDTCGPCRETTATLKQRLKDRKKNLKLVMFLVDNTTIDYNERDAVIGNAVMRVHYAKQELQRAKVDDKILKKRKRKMS